MGGNIGATGTIDPVDNVETASVSTSITEMIAFLRGLPSTNEREFEDGIANKLSKSPVSITKDLKDILDQEMDNELRFRAFFGLTWYHRRHNNYSEIRRLVQSYMSEFENYHIANHVHSLMHKGSGDRHGILESIKYARMAVEKLNRHVGVLHNYCESVVMAIEEGIELPEQDDLYNATSYIDTVIALSPDYAKFYCTKGRLLALQNKIPEAKANIMRAIDLENSDSNDYSIRISDYKNHLLQIKALERYTKFNNEITESVEKIQTTELEVQKIVQTAKENMEHLKNQNIQMLAYFTAIISFIIGSISMLSAKQTFLEAAMLIMILAGTLILVNIGLSMFFETNKKMMWKYIVVASIGAGLIIASMITYYCLK